MSILDNGSIVMLSNLKKGIFIDFDKQEELFKQQEEELRIKMGSQYDLITSLSGGNQQKVIIARWLLKNSDIFIFDEPTTGLHFYDVEKLLKSFDALLAKGHSIVVVEHNLDVIRAADWVIDLGPEAGDGGGNLVYAGRPEDIKGCNESHTAKYL